MCMIERPSSMEYVPLDKTGSEVSCLDFCGVPADLR